MALVLWVVLLVLAVYLRHFSGETRKPFSPPPVVLGAAVDFAGTVAVTGVIGLGLDLWLRWHGLTGKELDHLVFQGPLVSVIAPLVALFYAGLGGCIAAAIAKQREGLHATTTAAEAVIPCWLVVVGYGGGYLGWWSFVPLSLGAAALGGGAAHQLRMRAGSRGRTARRKSNRDNP